MKRAIEGIRGWMNRARMMKLMWYGALALLLVILGAASTAYRARRNGPEMGEEPVTVMAAGTLEPLAALFELPAPSPEPTPEPVAFAWPLEGEIIGAFSPEALVWSETLGQWQAHPGIDIAAAAGEAVAVCADGTVTDAWLDPLWGNVVEITHREGYVSAYANLNSLNMVSVGDEVALGQVIGAVGNSADCESELPWHLHFELRKDGAPVDGTKVFG